MMHQNSISLLKADGFVQITAISLSGKEEQNMMEYLKSLSTVLLKKHSLTTPFSSGKERKERREIRSYVPGRKKIPVENRNV